jgi:folate-binding protein YgfZ
MDAWRVFDWPREIVEVSGPDAAVYLQGQLTQDVAGLAVSDAAWALLLTPQGRVVGWLRVFRVAEDRFWLDVDLGSGDGVQERLTKFKLRTKATIELLVGWSCLAVRGPGGDQAVAASEWSPLGRAVPLRWPPWVGIDLIGPEEDLVRLRAALSSAQGPGCLGSYEEFQRQRILFGLPAMGSEITDKSIPAELGWLDRTVSFKKGCYVGQELVARMDARGNRAPRRLVGVQWCSGPTPEAGDELYAELDPPGGPGTGDGADRPIGTVTSSSYLPPNPDGGASSDGAALAMVRRDATVPGPAYIRRSGAEEPTVVELIELPSS